MQYLAMLWTQNKGKLVQVFGPYPSEDAADAAADRLADWPAMKNGIWETVPLYPDPPQQPAQTVSTVIHQLIGHAAPQWTYTYDPFQTSRTVRFNYGTIGFGGRAIPVTNAEITFKATP